MTEYNGYMCCTAQEYISVCDVFTYRNHSNAKKFVVARRGCRGTEALIYMHSIQDYKIKRRIEENDKSKKADPLIFANTLVDDPEASHFFKAVRVGESKELKAYVQKTLANNAIILNGFANKLQGILKMQANGATTRGFWTDAVDLLDSLQNYYPHNLPKSTKRLKEKFEKYKELGYWALIKDNYGNDNRRDVNPELEKLLKSIYIQSFKPNVAEVHKAYDEFLAGALSIVTAEGEIFDPKDYVPVSESTVRRYLTMWQNQVATDKKRSQNRIQYNAKHRPYADTVTDYAGSIVSMDDRDLPWKLHNGKRAIAYMTLDVASKCFIGWAFTKPSERKDDGYGKSLKLVMNCFRNTFEQLDEYGVNMPAEVECENHLMSSLAETTLKEGNLFRYVRYAAPENPQEKEIERCFKVLRYKFDKKQNNGAGWCARPFAKNEANQSRMEDDVKVTYSFDEICAMAEDSIIKYNNSLHPNQKKYKGKTRLDVFLENQHPKLLPLNWRDISRWVGYRRKTSVNRFEVRCNNRKFLIENPYMMNKLGVHAEVTAYWMRENTIYLYRGNEYIGEATTKPVFHKARIEQEDADVKAIAKMSGFTAKVDKIANDGKKALEPVTILKNENTNYDNTWREVQTFEQEPEEFNYNSINRAKYAPSSILDKL